ncbi:MAG: HAMP domain-containing protein [Spartobacteria bacterium]|nr:HAMP domain-containing protein [Spartobacteria bacterium]
MTHQSLQVNAKSFAVLNQLISSLVDINNQAADKTVVAALANVSKTTSIVLISVVLGVFIAMVFGYVIAGNLARRIQFVQDGMCRLAAGDIEMDIPAGSNDEVGQIQEALAQMVNVLRDMIHDIESVASKAVQGYLRSQADVSAQKGAYADLGHAINNALKQLVTVIDAMPSSVMFINKEFEIQFANKACSALLDVQEGQMSGKLCHALFETADDDSDNTVASEDATTKELTVQLDDRTIDILYTAIPMHDGKGGVVGALEVAQDITEIKTLNRDAQKRVIEAQQAIEKAERRAVYQSGEVEKVITNLEQLAQGDLALNTTVAPASEETNDLFEQFDKIAKALERSADAVGGLVEDAATLAHAAMEGRLDVRADQSKHQGEYLRVIEGMNNMLNDVVMPLNEAAGVLQGAANNDLTGKVKGQYKGQLADLKNNVNAMMKNLSEALNQVASTVHQVNSGADQIKDANQSLSEGATQQASAVEEITSSLEEIGSQTKINAKNASHANMLANRARDAAETGNGQMQDMVAAMSDINASSQQIAKIIKVIDDIAFQTNLLALNAAVEAARAGSYGKGFAVVADEVRSLAGRSARASHETAELIDASTGKVRHGLQMAETTSASFKKIVDSIAEASDLVGDIAQASNEQANGIAQVNLGLSQISQVTQQNTANTEETAAAAEELRGQAAKLLMQVAQFDLNSDEIPADFGACMAVTRF